MSTHRSCRNVKDAVFAVLAGAPLNTTAATIAMQPDDLADAVALFTAAGSAAIDAAHREGDEWLQASIEFATWETAEPTVIHQLLPALRELPATVTWWYVRKAPCWRFRFHTNGQHRDTVTSLLDGLTHGTGVRWRPGRYEPETPAFGGTAGIQIAHRLFHTDSAATLDYLHRHHQAIGRRELSILLLTTLLRAAGQEWHEQGDVWHRVTRLRAPATPAPKLVADVGRLLSIDVTAVVAANPRLAFATRWLANLNASGHQLRHAAHTATLDRGLRAVLAHHVIFHWNRLGIPDQTQALLAHAAHNAIMNDDAPRA